ncbi:uncharacterized protein [Asterias amurensis]|uniref:uncharacterized protein n=1 Tax=Asterias amurensis TaxID=7602 RepID=UPI003AB16BCA
MISYCPNTGAFLAKNIYENQKNQVVKHPAENGCITESINTNGHFRKSNSEHMNGHVVSSSPSDLGPGFTIVEPPTEIVPRVAVDKMAPTPDSLHTKKTTNHVRFSQDAPSDFSDPLLAESPRKDRKTHPKLKNQSTQTDISLLKYSKLEVRLKRSSNSSRESDNTVLHYRDTPPTASWSCSSSLSGSVSSLSDRAPGSPDGADSVFSAVSPAPSSVEEIPLSAILIGDSGTGKTCLVARLAEDLFMGNNYDVTVGIDFNIARVVLPDGRPVRLQLWDTAGQEKYRSITSSYYRKAMGVLLVYDVCRRDSLQNILHVWKKEVEKYAEPDVVLMLVGNKMDLDDHRTITTRVGAKVAVELGASFYEVSAKEDLNVKMAFKAFAQDILENVYASRNPCMSPSAVRLDNITNHARADKKGRNNSLCYC